MKSPSSLPEGLRGLVGRLARQLELPFAARSPEPTREPDVAAPPLRGASRARRIRLGERTIDYAFRRGRRRTIGITVTSDGVTVAAPRWVAIAEVEAMLRSREAWIFAKLAELRRVRAATPAVRWGDGGTFPFVGADVTMRLAVGTGGTRYDATTRTLAVALPPDASARQWRERVEAWLRAEARTLFVERLAHFETRLGVRHRTLRLSSARTRWGSCSADGRILLHWRLVHFPLSSIDYVVAHELAHLKEMNHGPRFWATVASVVPEFEAARAQMRDPPPALLPTW